MIKNCVICNKEYTRPGKQAENAKTCSKKCMGLLNRAKPNITCTQCNEEFHMKESRQKRYKRKHGYFCSTKCVTDFRKIKYLGEENPNFRIQVTTDWDGYKLDYIPKFGRIKLHHKVVFETLGINKIPSGYCTHHRDCNIENNDPENLVVITHSDHKWLHKQFGNATLWAYINNKITLEELMQWTNNKKRTEMLLPLNILDQKTTGIFKLDEFRETPEVDNSELSL